MEQLIEAAGGSDGDLGSDCERLLEGWTVDQALARLSESGVAAVAVLERDDVFTAPLLLENGFFFRVDDAGVGPLKAVRSFAKWERVPRPDVAFTPGRP
jgi:crotonobetainyl-CoA:carnitine CoA-transferase CaiB-like acyl-CoA transferase